MRKEKNKIDANILDQKESDKKNKTPKTGKKTINEYIEEYLESKYYFQYNVIKCKPEYSLIKSEGDFKQVDKFTVNSLKRELDSNQIKTSTATIKEILISDFSLRVNPVKNYFESLPEWNLSVDYISLLSDTVIVTNPLQWTDYFKRWVVGCVAQVFIEDYCANHVCLVLTGGQGGYKTTWLNNLCPKKLKKYLYVGKLDPNSKDALTYIAECFLINIDDHLKALNKSDENQLKNLITTPNVMYRRPYDEFINEYPHLASFMASVNGNDFLTDPTGSRRFLPFEVKLQGIDIKKAQEFNMNLFWSQAYSLFKSNFKYWFSGEDISELEKNNQMFQVVSQEEDILLHFYKCPENRHLATNTYTTGVLLSNLQERSNLKLSPKKLGEALTKNKFIKWQKTENGQTQWVWSVIEKGGLEISSQVLNEDKELQVF